MPLKGVHKEWGYMGHEIRAFPKIRRNKSGLVRGTVDTWEELQLLRMRICTTDHPEVETRIEKYRERAEKGLPLFD